jgi:hypothetical protein
LSPPVHSQDWRRRWEDLTEELEEVLKAEEPDADTIVELVRKRQRLMMSGAPNNPDDQATDREEQLTWLQKMVVREKNVQNSVGKILGNFSDYMESLLAGERIRQRLPTGGQTPTLLDREL